MKQKISLMMVILLLCSALCLCSGCAGRQGQPSSQGRDAIKYISEKYQQEFTPLSYDLSDYMSDRDVVECYTEGMDPENEHVSIYITKKDGKTVYHDNYADFLLRDTIEQHVTNVAKNEFRECKTFKSTGAAPLPDKLNKNSTLDDMYRQNPDYEIWCVVLIREEPDLSYDDYAKKIDAIEKQLSSEGHIYIIQIYAVSDELYESTQRYQRDLFDSYCVKNDSADGSNLFYIYNATIDRENVTV